jgi:hypothetical protein
MSARPAHRAPALPGRSYAPINTRKLVSLLKSGGLLAITLRHGPADPDRIMYPVSLAEIERLARDHGLIQPPHLSTCVR